mmetsp:Transcript_51623/g.109692  ORF Transcript_51623/g.109692 Transcript_51623/m.109692 type:complete len:394 (-) Transcript_51623:60-1241(-)
MAQPVIPTTTASRLLWLVLALVSLTTCVHFWRATTLLDEGSDSLDEGGDYSPYDSHHHLRKGTISLLQVPSKNLKPSLDFPMPQEGRAKQCINRSYNTSAMPQSLELAMHTVGSLIGNTPPELLQEILLIDDGNEKDWTYESTLTKLHPKVKYHRNNQRQGLIKAKKTGADLTDAPVIVFLEPHCLANRQWLEPLLERLMQDKKRVVIPVIDILPEKDPSKYVYVAGMYGGFKWNLEFNWMGTASGRNASYKIPDPFPMPSMSGGLLAMWRDWWLESGEYDSQMTEWGSEHIEMSLRIWRCGGTVEAVPCSRVGHMFRGHRPYAFHGEAAVKNKKRLIDTWLDNYKEKAEQVSQGTKNIDGGDISDRLAIRDKLKCHDMDWYIKNVYPELAFY